MNDRYLVLILAAFIILREVYFFAQIHRLIDKLMSRNLHEFKMAQQVGKAVIANGPFGSLQVREEDSDVEDLGRV